MLCHEWLPSTDDRQSRSGNNDGSRADERRDADSSCDDEGDIRLATARAKALPKTTGKFGSNHVLINKERIKKNVKPLSRDRVLDDIASRHAKRMASEDTLQHSDVGTTVADIVKWGPCRVVGENVTKQASTKYATRTAHTKLFSKAGHDR